MTPAEVLEGRAQWCVVEGDCLEVLPTLGDRSVAHVLSDPPYSRGLYLKFRTNGAARSDRAYSDNHAALADLRIGAVEDVIGAGKEFLRVAKRWAIAFHDAESGHLWREQFGKNYVRSGVWVKPNAMPQLSGDRPGQGFESVTIAHRSGRKRWNGGGLPAVWIHNAVQGNFPERSGNAHPCPKPLSLMLELVELFTDPGEVILDPFAGSGTTGVACLRLGRRFIGIERDAKYAAIARERLAAESQGLSLRAARAGQLSMFGGTR